MITKLSTLEPPLKKHSRWEDFGIRPNSAWIAFLALVAMPFAVFVGLLPAHLPYLFWPQYEAGANTGPIWFELLVGGLLLAPPLLLAGYGIEASRRAVRNGHPVAWLPAACFGAFFAYAAWALVATLLG